MKRKILSLVLVCCVVFGMSVPAYAADGTSGEEYVQEEINRTMEKVMLYLNEHQDLTLECREVREYSIPIEDGKFVTVKVENKQETDGLNPRAGGASGLARKYYDVVVGRTYTYTLTITDFYLFSGEIVYRVNYTVDSGGDNIAFPLHVNSVSVEADPPFGFSLEETDALDRSDGDSRIIVETAGYAMFEGPLGGNLTMMVEVTFSGMIVGGSKQVIVDYVYYDIDDV